MYVRVSEKAKYRPGIKTIVNQQAMHEELKLTQSEGNKRTWKKIELVTRIIKERKPEEGIYTKTKNYKLERDRSCESSLYW